jgi:hypothetical protein
MWHIPYVSCVDQSRIQSLIFFFVNLESSHALSQYLEPHKEFFIWLHALGISQSYLNLWDHHDLDIEPYLEFFSCSQTLKILKLLGLTDKLEHGLLKFYTRTIISSSWSYWIYLFYSMILMPILKISLSSWHSSLESNTWTSSNSYEQFLYKNLNENISS